MNVGRTTGARARSRGVATIEMAVVLPVLLLLVVATAEFGRAFIQYTTLSNAVRNGARYVAGKALSGTTGAISLTNPLIAETRNVVVFGTTTGGTTPVLPDLATNQVTVARTGNDVAVTAVYPFDSLFQGLLPTFGTGGGPISTAFNMTVVVRMRPI